MLLKYGVKVPIAPSQLKKHILNVNQNRYIYAHTKMLIKITMFINLQDVLSFYKSVNVPVVTEKYGTMLLFNEDKLLLNNMIKI